MYFFLIRFIFAYLGISCLVWYPIFTLWRDMRNGKFPLNREQPEYHPPPGYYATPPPTTVQIQENDNEHVSELPQKN